MMRLEYSLDEINEVSQTLLEQL
ncbi:MAG: hypothetical protein RLZZ205_517, partial [Bacteroidota bacterium]